MSHPAHVTRGHILQPPNLKDLRRFVISFRAGEEEPREIGHPDRPSNI